MCRGSRIRTYDLMVPNHAYYRTVLFPVMCDSAAARTQDSYIKSVVLYQLSYEIILRK